MFAGINDPLNFLTVNTTTGSPFNQSFSLVLAADSSGEGVVVEALEGLDAINRLRFPGAVSTIGVTTGEGSHHARAWLQCPCSLLVVAVWFVIVPVRCAPCLSSLGYSVSSQVWRTSS